MNLLEYWPPFLREITEFKQIAVAEQPEFDTAALAVRTAPGDFFLASLTEHGAARWERILGLPTPSGRTLEERREQIRIKYVSRLPYTYRMLLAYLAEAAGGPSVILDNDAYKLIIQVILSSEAQRRTLAAVLAEMIPANLVLILQIKIPQSVARPPMVAAAAMLTYNRHEHIPEGR